MGFSAACVCSRYDGQKAMDGAVISRMELGNHGAFCVAQCPTGLKKISEPLGPFWKVAQSRMPDGLRKGERWRSKQYNPDPLGMHIRKKQKRGKEGWITRNF